MSQDHNLIGELAPPANAVAAERIGWQDGQPAEDLGAEITDASDFSFWDRRANKQQLGARGGTFLSHDPDTVMAAHVEEPMAGRDVTPPGP
jgi:hypothetical protein